MNYDRYYPPLNNPMPPASGSSIRPEPQRLPVMPPPPEPVRPAPSVKLERIVLAPGPQLQGQVVRRDNSPVAGASLIFVSASRRGTQQTVTADATGQFRVNLAAGSWDVYVNGKDGQPMLHKQIDLRDNETRLVTLASR
jgi:hypothetical protein